MEHEKVTTIATSPTRWPFVAIATASVGLVVAIGLGCQTSPERSQETVVTEADDAEELPTADQHHQPQPPETDVEGDHTTPPHSDVDGGEDGAPEPMVSDQPSTHEPSPEADPGQSVQTTDPETSTTDPRIETDGEPPRQTTGDSPRESTSSSPSTEHHVDGEIPTSPEDISDSTTRKFAAAYIDVVDLQAAYEPRIDSSSDPDDVAVLQQQLEAEIDDAIERHDLSLAEFNAIAELLEADETLRDRIQSEVDDLAH